MNEKQQRAKVALDELLKLGFTPKDIADHLRINVSTISHIKNLDYAPEFYVSDRLANRLEQMVLFACKARCEVAYSHLYIQVLETCNNVGANVNQLNPEIRLAFVKALSSAFIQDEPQVCLPDGIEGAMASLGKNLIIVMVQPQTDAEDNEGEIKRLRLLIHELEHLIQKLRASLPLQEETYRPVPGF